MFAIVWSIWDIGFQGNLQGGSYFFDVVYRVSWGLLTGTAQTYLRWQRSLHESAYHVDFLMMYECLKYGGRHIVKMVATKWPRQHCIQTLTGLTAVVTSAQS